VESNVYTTDSKGGQSFGERQEKGSIQITGAMYNLASGVVDFVS